MSDYLCLSKEEVNKKFFEFIRRRVEDINYEMKDTNDEKISDETKSVLKVLKFKLLKDAGEGLVEDE